MGSDRSCWFWAYFFTIFLALKKGEGVSAALLAIFLRKKGSDSPFFIILFTESYCSPPGPESCARPIIFALKAVADPAVQLISPWEKVAFSATVGSFMDLRSRGASEIEVQQFFKDHVKFCTIVFRGCKERGESRLFLAM